MHSEPSVEIIRRKDSQVPAEHVSQCRARSILDLMVEKKILTPVTGIESRLSSTHLYRMRILACQYRLLHKVRHQNTS